MRTRRIIEAVLALGILTSVMSVVWGAEAPDLEQDAIGQTPPRLSLTTGQVSFWRPGAEDWSQAQVNTPLAPGDQLYTGSDGNLEIQIGSRAFVRGGANTQLGFENHEPDFLQFKVTEGNGSFDLRTVESGRTVEVNTPNAVFTIEHAGYYRVDVSGERTSFITRRGGQATVTSIGKQAVAIEPSEEVVIEGNENPQVASYAAPQLDEWDKWNYARTDHLLDAVSSRYVSPGVYGVDDLDRHGNWRNVPTYGSVWVPRAVPAGWAPYSTGSWMLDPYYGWTWVDTYPWGWAPYHYGRWVYVDPYWAWAPGPVVVRPAYAPALVAFFGGPHLGITVSTGSAVGWVALGWGEPCVPWWGPAHVRHRPWWGGWGGPRVVNNVVVKQTTVVNVQEIHMYRNTSVRNAVLAVDEKHFGRGPVRTARVPQGDGKTFRPIHTPPPVTATPASFVPRESRGIRPPEKILGRSVVATRIPHAGREAPAGIERKTAPAQVTGPEPHIVSVPQKREMSPALQRPPFGQSKVERRTTDRAQPPSPPKIEGQRRTEQASGGTPPVTRQTPPPKQRESQVSGRSNERPQPLGREPELDRTPLPAPPKIEGQRRTEPSGRTPPVTRQTPERREPQVVSPLGRPSETARPPARVLPGEPANRLSPGRSYNGREQQGKSKESPRQFVPEGTPEKVPQKRPRS